MSYLIDRRLDGKNKSAVNRQRFIKRYKDQLKKAVSDAMQGRSIKDMDKGEKVNIPSKDISEPRFTHGSGGLKQIIHPGNRQFNSGDRVPRPQQGGGKGKGSKASKDGSGDDEFVFELSRSEFLDLMFEDLALPDLVKKELAREPDYKSVRAGYTTAGVPSNISIVRSMRQSLARRVALSASTRRRLREAEEELNRLIDQVTLPHPKVNQLMDEVERLKAKIRKVPFIDTFDLRYNNRIRVPQPSTRAVMFCLMDVSGSMDQFRKDLAKRFFVLLYMFLQRNYERIDVVFIRHHTIAKEVTEEEFFYARETGGTVVSSALYLMRDIMRERYPTSAWNIYAAQASDGDNWEADSPGCRQLLTEDIVPLVQYFSYVEVNASRHQSLWHEYTKIEATHSNFAMKQINKAEDIYPVFRELFEKRERAA
ncbi:MAG: YeaH/YhbH family protein [Pseudomonadota bacterium]